MKYPSIIEFSQIGKPELGFLSVGEVKSNVPFRINRVFWSYYTPQNVIRGRHAHYETEMVLIAVAGIVEVNTECIDASKHHFILDKPNVGLFLPKLCWHTMQYSHNAVQLVLASSFYDESDYIRNYQKFLNLQKKSS